MENKKQYVVSAWFISLLFIICNLFEIKWLWGFNFLKFYNSSFTYIISAILIIGMMGITIFWKKDNFNIITKLNRFADRISNTVVMIFIMLVMGLLFFSYPSKTLLLGDSSLRIFEILSGKMILKTELLDFFIHSASYHYLFDSLGKKPEFVYYLISPICGFIFIIGVFRLASYLTEENVITTSLLLMSSGVIVLFFGYVESYALVAALLPYLYLAGLKVVDNKSSLSKYMLWVLAAGLVHSVAFIIFIPSIVAMIMIYKLKILNLSKVLKIIFGAGLVLIAFIYLLHNYNVGTLGRYLMPLFEVDGYSHSIFSLNHYANILNWLLLAASPFLLFIPLIFSKDSLKLFFSNRKVFYALMIALPVFLFIFFFLPQLGGPRDWDLFAVVLFLLIPAVLTVYFSIPRKKIGLIVIPIILIAFINSFAFAVLNNDVKRTVNRFVEVIEVSKFKNLTIEYSTLVNFVDRHGLSYKRLEFLQKAWEQPPLKKYDSTGILSQLGIEYLKRNDSTNARKFLEKAIDCDQSHLKSYFILLDYLEKFGTKQEQLSFVDSMLVLFPKNSEVMRQAGIIYFQSGNLDRAGILLKNSYKLEPDNFDILLNYGLYLFNVNKYQESIEILLKANLIDESFFGVNYHIAAAYKNLGMNNKSRIYLENAKLLIRNERETNLYQILMNQF